MKKKRGLERVKEGGGNGVGDRWGSWQARGTCLHGSVCMNVTTQQW